MPSRLVPWLVVGVISLAGAVVVGVAALVLGRPGPLAIRPIADQQIEELATLRITPRLVDPAAAARGEVAFSLAEAPPGAVIDASTGQFAWTPTEEQGPGTYVVRLRVASGERRSERAFRVTVAEVDRPPTIGPIEPKTTAPGSPVAFAVAAADPDRPAQTLRYRLLGDPPAGARIDAKTGRFEWDLRQAEPDKTYRITVGVVETGPGGLAAKRTFEVRVEPPAPQPLVAAVASDARVPLAPPVPSVEDTGKASGTQAREEPTSPSSPPQPSAQEAEDQRLLALVPKNQIFVSKNYTALREVFAARFQREQAPAIRRGCGDRHEATEKWLSAHAAIREELYTAIDPARDDVAAATGLFSELVAKYPDRLPAYADLAIALAVTWDKPAEGVYDYVGHQHRTKSTLPEGRLGAIENFQYLLDTEKLMEGREQAMPWEFLVHVVNHRTPLVERQWVLTNYLPKRVMFGKCYQDVPYDEQMRDSASAVARLNGHVYNLASIRQFGGVCAIQADFAARVGKSLGVPAAYVSGESRGGESHAWVMWVELLGVSRTSIRFSLQSHGRYLGDCYYVGTLTDPQTGQRITDRQLELRLHTVGMNAQNKRHAALVMRAYPMLRQKTDMDATEQLQFLNRVIALSPGNEDAWRTIARMSKDGQFSQRHAKVMMATLDRLFATFANYPDFTWEIFADLVAFQTVPKQRTRLYEQLVALYVQAKRPDLACEAVLEYAGQLASEGREDEAIRGLSSTILAFPDEGRYVPKMLDRLETLAPKLRGGQEQLLDFYQQLLPKVPRMRGSRPSPYCIKMYQRAIARFTAAGRAEAAEAWQAELAKLQASQKSTTPGQP